MTDDGMERGDEYKYMNHKIKSEMSESVTATPDHS